MKRLLLVFGILLLFATEIFRVYFIMPFPGSQHHNTLNLAFFIDQHRIWLRIAGFLIVGYALFIHPARRGNPYAPRRKKSYWPAIAILFLAGLYGIIFYLFNYRFEADKMFRQPQHVAFTDNSDHQLNPNRLVIGVFINGEAKAYPIRIIGYHHQVRDTLGHTPIMVTYCTVCRTGRVYSPLVHGKPQTFRLVGMDHFNAMFEDQATGSWWQQATGVAVAGPLKGTHLKEIPSAQHTLGEWLRLHPESKVMMPDSLFSARYAGLDNYDNGTITGSLERRDSGSWKAKSWVIGVLNGPRAKAYDWSTLASFTQDSIGRLPILICRPDSINFQVFSRVIGGRTLYFQRIEGDVSEGPLRDTVTHSVWNLEGHCVSGPLTGEQLQPLQSYQEFWHSWRHFHPRTTRYAL